MKLTQEQREDFEQAMEHWVRVCKIADEEMEKPYTKNTEIIIGDLKRAKKYIETNYGGWFYHPLLSWEDDNVRH